MGSEKSSLMIRSDGSEMLSYDIPDFSFFVRHNVIAETSFLSMSRSHWHDDIEMIYVLSGSIKYNINGDIITMHEGEGVFVNSRQFHNILSDGGGPVSFYCMLFHPLLLCASRAVSRQYVSPITENPSLAYIPLSDKVEWQSHILSRINDIYSANSLSTSPLAVQSLLFDIWKKLYENIGSCDISVTGNEQQMKSMKEMILFIHANYSRNITLSDICSSCGVSKTSCTTIFKRYVHQTPMSYLTSYRLQRASKLLNETDLSITEIAYDTGFSGASYFSETFRKNFGCSPRDYRHAEKRMQDD